MAKITGYYLWYRGFRLDALMSNEMLLLCMQEIDRLLRPRWLA